MPSAGRRGHGGGRWRGRVWSPCGDSHPRSEHRLTALAAVCYTPRGKPGERARVDGQADTSGGRRALGHSADSGQSGAGGVHLRLRGGWGSSAGGNSRRFAGSADSRRDDAEAGRFRGAAGTQVRS